jgi:hypothetical protein
MMRERFRSNRGGTHLYLRPLAALWLSGDRTLRARTSLALATSVE